MKIIGCSRYESLVVNSGRCYGFKSLLIGKDITEEIDYIELIDFEEEDPNRPAKMAVIGGIAGGWAGALISSLLLGGSKALLKARIHMKNGEVIQIESEKKKDFRFVYDFVNSKR